MLVELNEEMTPGGATPQAQPKDSGPSSTAHTWHCPIIAMLTSLPCAPTATRPKLKKMKSQTGQVGEKQSLKCEAVAGNPLPSYRWFKDGKELNRSRDIRIKYGNGR